MSNYMWELLCGLFDKAATEPDGYGVAPDESFGNDQYAPIEEIKSVTGDETEVREVKFSGGRSDSYTATRDE
jgi:hypothetical protein